MCRKDREKDHVLFRDTHMEKAPSNETPSLTKSTNIGIWVVSTTNQLFIKCPSTGALFSER